MANKNKVFESKHYGEVTTIRTIRITVVNKVPNDESKAMKLVEADQKRIIRALKKLGIDGIEVVNEKTFMNLDDNKSDTGK